MADSNTKTSMVAAWVGGIVVVLAVVAWFAGWFGGGNAPQTATEGSGATTEQPATTGTTEPPAATGSTAEPQAPAAGGTGTTTNTTQ